MSRKGLNLLLLVLLVGCSTREAPTADASPQATSSAPSPVVAATSSSPPPTLAASPSSTFNEAQAVDARGDVKLLGCEPEPVVLGHKRIVVVEVTNRAPQPRTYRVTVGVVNDAGRVLDREAEWFFAVGPGESRANRWAIRTALEPSGCVVVDALAG